MPLNLPAFQGLTKDANGGSQEVLVTIEVGCELKSWEGNAGDASNAYSSANAVCKSHADGLRELYVSLKTPLRFYAVGALLSKYLRGVFRAKTRRAPAGKL